MLQTVERDDLECGPMSTYIERVETYFWGLNIPVFINPQTSPNDQSY
jgi:hypothetical protein